MWIKSCKGYPLSHLTYNYLNIPPYADSRIFKINPTTVVEDCNVSSVSSDERYTIGNVSAIFDAIMVFTVTITTMMPKHVTQTAFITSHLTRYSNISRRLCNARHFSFRTIYNLQIEIILLNFERIYVLFMT